MINNNRAIKLSIITINRNNAAGLKKTILSVVDQTFPDFEYIIIDGNSNDDSKNIINEFNSKINYWVSEPDTGVYNAMNKGIRKAQGDFCLFLNSGDWLIDNNTLSRLFQEMEQTEEAGIYYTDCVATNHPYFQPPKKLDINYLVIHNLNHQNTIIKRSLFWEHGFYNEKLRIASDYEFWLREFWIYKTKFRYIKTNIAIYDSYGMSSVNNFDSELEDCIRNVFCSLGESLVKLRRFSHGTYGIIIEKYGESKFLEFCLKVYNNIIKIFKRRKLDSKENN